MSTSNDNNTASGAGAYRHQDGQALFLSRPDSDAHAQWRLPQRVSDEWSDEDVRVLWRKGVPVDFPPAENDAYARYHAETGTVLIADYGFLSTIYQLNECPEWVQERVLRQVNL